MPLATHVRMLSALAGLAVLAGCARLEPPAAPRPEILLTELPAPVGRQCVVTETPTALPHVDAVVDSAALDGALRALWRERREGPGYALLSVAFDRNGWNSRRQVIEHDLPAPLADSLQALVFAHRRELEPGEPWGARLRIDLDETPRFRMGRQEVCAARLLDEPEPGAMGVMWSPRDRFASYSPSRAVWVRVLVDEHGGIAEARLEHGGVAGRAESMLISFVHTLSFQPATVDGIPVPSWTRFPIPIR